MVKRVEHGITDKSWREIGDAELERDDTANVLDGNPKMETNRN